MWKKLRISLFSWQSPVPLQRELYAFLFLFLWLLLQTARTTPSVLSYPPFPVFLAYLPLMGIWESFHQEKALICQLPLSSREQVTLSFFSGFLTVLLMNTLILGFYMLNGNRSLLLIGNAAGQPAVLRDYAVDLIMFLLLSLWVYELAYPLCLKKDLSDALLRALPPIGAAIAWPMLLSGFKMPLKEDPLWNGNGSHLLGRLTDSALLPGGAVWAAGLFVAVVLTGVWTLRKSVLTWEQIHRGEDSLARQDRQTTVLRETPSAAKQLPLEEAKTIQPAAVPPHPITKKEHAERFLPGLEKSISPEQAALSVTKLRVRREELRFSFSQGFKSSHFQLGDLSFSLPKGFVTGLIGPNGSGKTTLIEALGGGLPCEAGTIESNGVSYPDGYETLHRKMSLVFDKPNWDRIMTIRGVASYISQREPWFDQSFLENKLAALDIPLDVDSEKLPLSDLRKAQLCLMLARKPEILIVDEITTGLDPLSRHHVRDLLMEFMEDETHTLFFSTHETADLDRIADYVMMLDDGQILFFTEKQKLQEAFGSQDGTFPGIRDIMTQVWKEETKT